MATYCYKCLKCNHNFEVIKPMSEYKTPEDCPDCKAPEAQKLITNFSFYGESDWDNAQYNPAFGKVIKNQKQAKEEAKRRGMIEVGNEPVENLHREAEKTLERNIEDAWSKV